MKVKKRKATHRKVVRLPRSAGMSRERVMSLYRREVKKLRANQKPIQINQINTVIGTDSNWNNAQVINRNPAWIVLNNASYVWSARDLNSDNAIISRRFRLNPNRPILRGRLTLSVDNYAVVLINGNIVRFDAPQNTPSFFMQGRTFNIRRFLRRGANDIVIVAFNFGGPRSQANPAGVAARLNIRLGELQ